MTSPSPTEPITSSASAISASKTSEAVEFIAARTPGSGIFPQFFPQGKGAESLIRGSAASSNPALGVVVWREPHNLPEETHVI